MMKFKTIKYIGAGLAGVIALTYVFGYEYLFNGISKTYLRGKTSATIDDGDLFPSHVIAKGVSKPIPHDSIYNKKTLPKNLVEDLKNSNTASFLVVKDGKILHEQYWNQYNANTPTNSFSMAKAVTVLLLGKALEEGKIKDINEKFSEFYDNYANVPYGKNLTLKNLAQMEAGLKWKENYKNPLLQNAKAYYGKSLAEAVLLRGFKQEPGQAFEYQSGSTQLLAFAIRKAVNEPLSTYLSRNFWIPMGMEQNARWSVDNNQMEKAFCCIHAVPRDFAKLGMLFLNHGKVGDKQIIKDSFLQEMVTPTQHSGGVYGMGMWINNDNPIKHYFYQGLQGQLIAIIPEKNMVIVKTGSFDDQPKNDRGRPDQVKFIVNETVKLFP